VNEIRTFVSEDKPTFLLHCNSVFYTYLPGLMPVKIKSNYILNYLKNNTSGLTKGRNVKHVSNESTSYFFLQQPYTRSFPLTVCLVQFKSSAL